MKAVYVQEGKNLDYKNTGSTVIAAGEVVVLGGHIGIAAGDIAVGEKGALCMEGVFRSTKKADEAITAGADVYYSEAGMTAVKAESAVSVGYAVNAAGEADGTVTVKLLG